MLRYRPLSNLPLKVIALVFAITLWLAVVNIDDPVESTIIRGVPVTVLNGDVVTNQGKVFQILEDTETVTVTVSAKRSLLGRIPSDNVVATADMNDLELGSLVPITATV